MLNSPHCANAGSSISLMRSKKYDCFCFFFSRFKNTSKLMTKEGHQTLITKMSALNVRPAQFHRFVNSTYKTRLKIDERIHGSHQIYTGVSFQQKFILFKKLMLNFQCKTKGIHICFSEILEGCEEKCGLTH